MSFPKNPAFFKPILNNLKMKKYYSMLITKFIFANFFGFKKIFLKNGFSTHRLCVLKWKNQKNFLELLFFSKFNKKPILKPFK